ncbi:PfkB family carbohydrate kinase [Methylobacillus sp.]|uniref:PfkB family carbohydrate kinase n=1 Tax=Methylobacillus sp. TaxID=56818 RepID=UPI002FE00BA8
MLANFKPVASSAYVLASLMIAHIYSVRRFPQNGESLQAEHFYCETGGKGLNVLVGLHKLGTPVSGIIPCGQHPFSQQQCRDILAQWQLDHIAITLTSEYNGHGVALVDAQGQNQIVVHPGANAVLNASHIQQHVTDIEQADLSYASFELPDAAICTAFSIARAAGRMTVLNPSPYREISPELLALTDVLIVNQTEAQTWLQSPAEYFTSRDAALNWLHSSHFNQRFPGKSLVMTLGGQGAVAMLEDGRTCQQAGLKTNVIDSVGAGDAFASAFLASMLRGNAIDAALQNGCASASLAIRQHGLLPHLPTMETLQSFLDRQGFDTNS